MSWFPSSGGARSMLTPNGRLVLDLISEIDCFNCIGVKREAANIPNPPALDTAATKSGVQEPPAILAWMMGYLMFNILQKFINVVICLEIFNIFSMHVFYILRMKFDTFFSDVLKSNFIRGPGIRDRIDTFLSLEKWHKESMTCKSLNFKTCIYLLIMVKIRSGSVELIMLEVWIKNL